MIKLNAFTTNIHAQYNFLKGGAIDRLIKDIKKEDLTDHPALVGNAKSTFTPKKGFLDRHHSVKHRVCLLYTSPSPRDKRQSRMPSSA